VRLIHVDANISDQLPKLYLFDSLNRTMCGGNMSHYSVSGAKPQPPNVFLDIIGAYVSAGWGKVAVIFLWHTPKKWGYGTPLQKVARKLRLCLFVEILAELRWQGPVPHRRLWQMS